MTWKDALIKLESTINFYNYQIQSLKIENDKLSNELKEYQIVITTINQYLNQSEKEDNPEAFLYGIECTLEFMGMRKKE